MIIFSFLTWLAIGLAIGIVSCSFFEWALHRFLMHTPRGWFNYPFERHTLVHHRVFRADDSYHLQREADKATVPMAWWNGPALIAASQVPFFLLAWALGQFPMLCGTVLATGFYYGTYEYLHWCMHVPARRKLERNGIFFRLNGHHLLHHRYMHKNYNVVLPLADLCLGTLLLRSKIRFAQARGVCVPDVQPLES